MLLVALLVIAAGGKSILFDTLDPDCFWHLRVADQLSREGVHPLVDEISFASMKQPWTPYSWLAELGMKAVWDFGGVRAAVATEAILVAAFFTFIALAAFERSCKLFTSCVLTFLGIVLCLPYLSFRPVTASLALLALCWWLLMRDRRIASDAESHLAAGLAPRETQDAIDVSRSQKGDIHLFSPHQPSKLAVRKRWMSPFCRLVWLIVPITALNVNLHFFAAFVPLWVGCLLISNRRYLPLFIASSLACLATPMLPGVITSVLRYQFSDPMLKAGLIAEFTPFYHGTMGAVLAALLVVLLARSFRNRNRISIGEWIALLISSALLFKLGRFAPVFAIVAIPLFAITAPALRDRVLGRPVIVAVLSLCVLLASLKIVIALPSRSVSPDQWINRHGPDVPGYPVEAAEFVARTIAPNSHRLINEFTWGGYLAWRMGDEYQVLMDGRTQLYAPAFWKSMYVQPKEDLLKVLSPIQADAAILPVMRSRFHDSLISLGWHSAFRDERAEVLVPPVTGVATLHDEAQ